MTHYRDYRGLFGERFRVPTHTIAKPARIHNGEAYPFALMAEKLGPMRDRFADIAARTVLLDDTMGDKNVRRMVARAAA